MPLRRPAQLVVAAAALLILHSAAAHHSRSNFSDQKLTLEGVVTSFEWKNPHVYFTVEVPGESGAARTWVIETHNTIVLGRRGWTPDSLAVGDEVVVSGSPDRDPNRLFVFGDWVIDKRSGERLVINGPSPNGTRPTCLASRCNASTANRISAVCGRWCRHPAASAIAISPPTCR